MKTAEEIIAHLEIVIANVVDKPQAYGLTPEEVEVTLRNFFHVWGFATDRTDDWHDAEMAIENELNDTRSVQLATKHRDRLPDADDKEILAAVIESWRAIVERVGISLELP